MQKQWGEPPLAEGVNRRHQGADKQDIVAYLSGMTMDTKFRRSRTGARGGEK
jgi:hypothetical protein